MLFTETPSSPDSHKISLEEVDLSKIDLDDDNPIARFSIRDHVNNARSKDTKKNWPFSEKSLQLSMKYGVKDLLLPPFQCFDCIKDGTSSMETERDGESSLSEKGKLPYMDGGHSNMSNDHMQSSPNKVGNIGSSDKELPVTTNNMCNDHMQSSPNKVGNIGSSDKQLPVTANNMTNDHMQSSPNKVGNIGSSDKQLPVTTNDLPPDEVVKTLENSDNFPKKPKSPRPRSTKKCKSKVKVGTNGDVQSSNFKTTSTIVEPMRSSKVCPVCQTFSSSSNTTLNAHIDQCLSADPPTEPSSRSKATVSKRKIKPRKTRLMVDICATALNCTLEELEQRNGRMSEKSTLPPVQETMVDVVKEKRQKASFEKKGEENAVYTDANGTKLLILNKISDTSSSVSKSEMNPRLLSKGKGCQSLSSDKNKQKQLKYVKLASPREKQCSYKTRLASQVLGERKSDSAMEDSPKTDEDVDANMSPSLQAEEQIKTHDSETLIPRWASNKQNNLSKRRFEMNQSSLQDSNHERSYAEKVPQCYGSLHLSHREGQVVDNSSYTSFINECHEQPPLEKPMELKSSGPQSRTSVDPTFPLKVTKFLPPREHITSVDQSSMCQPKLSKKRILRLKNAVNQDYNEKHLERQCRIDEDVGQLPLKGSTMLKIKKKKLPATVSQNNELTDNHNNHEFNPSPIVGADVEDGFADVKHPRRGKIVIGRSSGADYENVMSLTKGVKQDFDPLSDTDMEEMDLADVQANYFSGVDPIAIPGPPGSFLPSPGRMSPYEDYQGNSLLNSSPFQFSLDHEDMAGTDFSSSPNSGISTVSNTLATKIVHQSVDSWALDHRDPPHNIVNVGFSDEITKNTLRFQDSQPCCCSREQLVSINNQETQLLRQSVVSSFPLPKIEDPSNLYPHDISKVMNDNRCVYPRSQSGLGPISVEVPMIPPVSGNFGAHSPSSPNPILRLMGKNLMVASSDENINQYPTSKFQAVPRDHDIHSVTPCYGCKATNLDQHNYKPSFAGLANCLNGWRNSPFSLPECNIAERLETNSGLIPRNEESIVPKHRKEVIGIDDTQETETQTSCGGSYIPVAGNYNPSHLNTFCSYQESEFPPFNAPHMIPNVSSQMLPPSLGPTRWNNVLEGSSIPPPSSLTSSSRNHVRSSFYNPPSIS